MKRQNSNDTLYNDIINNIMIWILFGVLLSVAPTFFLVGYKMIVGLTFSFIECMPDVLLAIIAVGCNFMNICINQEKKIAHILRWIFGIITGIVVMGCWGLYVIIYFFANNEKLVNNIENNMQTLFIVALVIIGVCLFIGAVIEFNTTKENQLYMRISN